METITVDTAGAAARLGIAVKTLHNKRVYGGGPPFLKLGRRVLYRVSDLDAWMEAHLQHSTSKKVAA